MKFKKKELEQQYSLKSRHYQQQIFVIFYILFSLASTASWIALVGLGSVLTFFPFAIHLSRFFFAGLALLLFKRAPQRIEDFIIFIIFLTVLGDVESYLLNFHNCGIPPLFLFGIAIQTLSVFSIFLRMRFFKLAGLVFFANIYSALRLLQNEEFSRNSIQGILIAILNTIFLIFLAGGHEIYIRMNFFEMNKYEASLHLYEKLIKEVIPLSVIIYDDEKILYFNHESERLFSKVRGPEDISFYEKLKRTKIKKINGKPFFNSQKNYSSACINPESGVNLFKFIQKISLNSSEALSFKIEFLRASQDSEKDHTNFNMKVSNFSWEGSTAKIMLLIEDHSANEFNFLQQREIYKKNMLSTISHELRTPLNGIIGMISIALESCRDQAIRER